MKDSTKLVQENMALQEQVNALLKQVEDQDRKIRVLLKQADQWAKSYDTLLKDFIQFRDNHYIHKDYRSS